MAMEVRETPRYTPPTHTYNENLENAWVQVYIPCEKATEMFGVSSRQSNDGCISIDWLTQANVDTQNRSYQREKVSDRNWQRGIMETMLVNTYASIPQIHIRVIHVAENEYRYELIDGQQRMRAILDFINNEYSLPEDMVVNGCDIGGMHCQELRDTYPSIYEMIISYRVSCIWYEDLTDQETANLFIWVLNNVNDMKPQELRNAILGYYATFVRNTARGNGKKGKDAVAPHPLFERYTKTVKNGEDKEYLVNFSTKFALNGRMEVDEWLSSLIYFIENGWKKGITQDGHYKWVEKVSAPNGKYHGAVRGNFKDAKKIETILNFALELMKATPSEFKVKLNPMTSLMMVVYALELRNRDYKILPELFSPAFFDTYLRWSDTDTKLYMNHTTVNGHQMKEFSDLFGGKNGNAIGTIFKVLDMDWKGRDNEVGAIKLDSRETFPHKEVIKRWQEQGGKDFYTGKPVPENDIAGDHYIPRSWGIDRGGVTEYHNLVVCSRGINLRKGARHGDEFLEMIRSEVA